MLSGTLKQKIDLKTFEFSYISTFFSCSWETVVSAGPHSSYKKTSISLEVHLNTRGKRDDGFDKIGVLISGHSDIQMIALAYKKSKENQLVMDRIQISIRSGRGVDTDLVRKRANYWKQVKLMNYTLELNFKMCSNKNKLSIFSKLWIHFETCHQFLLKYLILRYYSLTNCFKFVVIVLKAQSIENCSGLLNGEEKCKTICPGKTPKIRGMWISLTQLLHSWRLIYP